jgi:hypothetical protein
MENEIEKGCARRRRARVIEEREAHRDANQTLSWEGTVYKNVFSLVAQPRERSTS